MRILVLVTDAYGANGGIAQFNRNLIAALASARGIEEVVVLPRTPGDGPRGGPGHLTYLDEASGGKARFTAALGRLLARDRDFDLVLSGHVHLLGLAALSARVTRAPLWLVIHGLESWRPSRHALANQLAGRVDLCVSVSRYSRDRFGAWSGLPPERTRVIPNSVDLARLTPGPRRADLVERYGLGRGPVVMTLGRLESERREKGFDRVLEVLPTLRSSFPSIQYLIAGSGPDRGRLEAKARALGVADAVVFTGFIEESEKADHYRLADVFAMPSRGEGFGIVLLEAMACGIPVVASALDGSKEAVRDGQLGELVDPADSHSVREGIVRALLRESPERSELECFADHRFRSEWQGLLGEAMARSARHGEPRSDSGSIIQPHAQ